MKTFYLLLANSTVVLVINFTVWFALTFYVYLQTRSVFATAMIAGTYLVMTALSGFWFGSLVDHNRKKSIMLISSAASFFIYLACFLIYSNAPAGAFSDPTNPLLWVFAPLLLCGVIAGNIRGIAIPTLVTILVPEDRRDKANGLVGTAFGLSFLVTSVISGLLVGYSGMYHVLLLAMAVTVLAMLHLWLIPVEEKEIVHLEDGKSKIDIKGTIAVLSLIPGLLALIFFTTFNNFLGGVFMALMDAYGLSLVSVQAWGLLWGVLSTAFILGGIIIARRGLGKNPLRTLFLANIVIWSIASVFTLQSSIILLAVGMFFYLAIIPAIEASEHTIIQKVVPLERQGRVFGFAQSVEQAASPLTAFLIGPIAQFIFIPFMTTGAGAALIGNWYGVGPERGIALVFTITGVIGLTVTILAMRSSYYRLLSKRYTEAAPTTPAAPQS